ncbi:hypothetical protein EZ456_05160 [Pedobacter psychrodurus]|uniref:Uncharacterized protein n=1 Tax=Pedobacter psychrodurus TaxID=2530456 RepID=A0A4R0PZS8_9SPHI|nr:hypothetical protein [Pedobacter psychrodurus]TCD28772.1 hypothetical protein EZ456_05160 [Pedobacter psychrodurus]
MKQTRRLLKFTSISDMEPVPDTSGDEAKKDLAKTAGIEIAAKTVKLMAGRLDYQRQGELEDSKRINREIFLSDLDIIQPIVFGITSNKLFINKNGPTLLLSSNKFATLTQYINSTYQRLFF